MSQQHLAAVSFWHHLRRYSSLEGKLSSFAVLPVRADRPMDSIFVDTENTDVKLCPGDRTHHEIHMRRGFRDTGAVNPHTRMPDAYRHYVAVPSARVARPVTCDASGTCIF